MEIDANMTKIQLEKTKLFEQNNETQDMNILFFKNGLIFYINNQRDKTRNNTKHYLTNLQILYKIRGKT